VNTAALPVQQKRAAAFGATAALLALIVLSVAWEWWLAPLRPGGSALVLKAVPLLLALPGVWRHRLYTLQWASMLILLYFAEGIVRGWSDRGLSARLGWLEVALAVVFFVCTLAYVAPFKRAAKRAAKENARQNAEQAKGSAP
jgi:Predicted membrane protein